MYDDMKLTGSASLTTFLEIISWRSRSLHLEFDSHEFEFALLSWQGSAHRHGVLSGPTFCPCDSVACAAHGLGPGPGSVPLSVLRGVERRYTLLLS